MSPRRSTIPIAEELRKLMAATPPRGGDSHSARPHSVRELAQRIGVNQAHLSRMLTGTRPLPKDVVVAIASAFALPPDHFAEYRRALVIETTRDEPWLLDPVYDRLRRGRT
jgi:transcriptional regulator with XRE-family HTH domain